MGVAEIASTLSRGDKVNTLIKAGHAGTKTNGTCSKKSLIMSFHPLKGCTCNLQCSTQPSLLSHERRSILGQLSSFFDFYWGAESSGAARDE